MPKLLSMLLFAAALTLGLGAGPSSTFACPMQNAQAESASSPVQLAMEEPDEGSDKAAYESSKAAADVESDDQKSE